MRILVSYSFRLDSAADASPHQRGGRAESVCRRAYPRRAFDTAQDAKSTNRPGARRVTGPDARPHRQSCWHTGLLVSGQLGVVGWEPGRTVTRVIQLRSGPAETSE